MTNAKQNLVRPLFCPICGTIVRVPVEAKESGTLPEVHRLPEHPSGNGANLCAGLVVTVTLDWDKCPKCDRQMCKHPSGVCRRCFEG